MVRNVKAPSECNEEKSNLWEMKNSNVIHNLQLNRVLAPSILFLIDLKNSNLWGTFRFRRSLQWKHKWMWFRNCLSCWLYVWWLSGRLFWSTSHGNTKRYSYSNYWTVSYVGLDSTDLERNIVALVTEGLHYLFADYLVTTILLQLNQMA